MATMPLEAPDPAPADPSANPRRARILEAAHQCFADKGFRNATIIDVAEAAGVSRPLVYKYFGDKDGLIDSVLQTTFDEWSELNAALAKASPAPSTDGSGSADPVRSLERKFTAAIDFVRERPVFRAILSHDPQIVIRGHLDALRRSRAVSLGATREIVRGGVASGGFRNDLDVESVASSLEMTLFGLLQRALGLQPELTLDDDLVETTLALLVGGLRAEARQP